MTNAGWIGPRVVVENYLDIVGADRDEHGRFVLAGETSWGPVSFMGAGDELVLDSALCYFVQGRRVPLVANMVSVLGQGAGRGVSVVVI